MNLNKLTEIFGAITGVLFVIFVIAGAYKFVTDDDGEDADDEVTITYNCTSVLKNIDKYDTFLIQQCRDLHDQQGK